MTQIFIDQMGRKVNVPFPPSRIVSIVPSQSELLFDLGLEKEVVGITKFCVHPKVQWKNKPRVGGTKKLHLDTIADLKPDLIIGNKEENDRLQIEELEKEFPVWMSDVSAFEEAIGMISAIGAITGRTLEAAMLTERIKVAFLELSTCQSPVPPSKSPTTAYVIWKNPYMVAARGTFIHDMLGRVGLINVFSSKTRYPETSLEELADLQPELILLSSEPFPFQEKHMEEFRQHCPAAAIKLVDGEMFSWYGSRLLLAAPYFAKLRHEIYRSF